MVDGEPVVRWAHERLAEGRRRREARHAVEELANRHTDPDTLLHAAGFFQHLGDHDAAILYARRATRLAPDSAQAWRQLAQSYKHTRRGVKALTAARRAVVLAPDAVESHLVLAEVLHSPASGRSRDQASQVLATAARLAPDDPRPRQAQRRLDRSARTFWIGVVGTAAAWAAIRGPLRFLHGVVRLAADAGLVLLILTVIVLGIRSDSRSRGQTFRERMRTRRARAREDDAGDDSDVVQLARGGVLGWPLVPLLALGAHVIAAAVGAPFPRWTLVFALAGTATFGGALWWWTDWWFGPGVARRAVRLGVPLRRQIVLAVVLIAVGVAVLAVGIAVPAVWTVVTLALIAWGLGGFLTLATRR